MNTWPKILVITAFFGSLIFAGIARAEISSPYVVDEKPQVLFGDSTQVDTYRGLENYAEDYVGGYLHITFTQTHHICCSASNPPVVYVTDVDPRTTSTPTVFSMDSISLAGQGTGWYLIDIQFDGSGYTLVIKETGENQVYTRHADIPDLTNTSFVSLANLYPWTEDDSGRTPNDFTMAFTPQPITNGPPPPARNPVLIVPGILGTQIFKEGEELWLDWVRTLIPGPDTFLDPLGFNDNLTPLDATLVLGGVLGKLPLYDYSQKLVEEFEDQGYAYDQDVFFFPYDWRYGVNSINLEALQQRIIDILAFTNSEQIDVIAHSNGGLIVKKYIMNNPSGHHIGKTIFVGVPSIGAPKAIKALLVGDHFGNPFLSPLEMKKLARNMPVVYDLSPSRQYFDRKGSYFGIKEYSLFSHTTTNLNFDETNDYLASNYSMNAQAIVNSDNLHSSSFDNYDLRNAGVDLYSIVGCKAGTIGNIYERKGVGSGFEIDDVPGDGTVPLESATNLPINVSNKFYSLTANHAGMMTQEGPRQQIVNIISGSNLSTPGITQDISQCELNGKAVSIFSPLSIDVADEHGNHSGLDAGGNIFNEIPNADFEVLDDHKFVYLPTDDGQNYTINLKGTGDGKFTLINSDIISNEIQNIQTFSEIPVTTNLKGSLNIDSSVLSLDTNGDGSIDFNLQGVPNQTTVMPYGFSGFLQPINDPKVAPAQPLSIFKAGSTVPVKFQLKDSAGKIIQAKTSPIWMIPTQEKAMNMTIDELTNTVAATSGTTYKWDVTAQQYVYNWGTKGLQAGFWYKIYAKLDDGNTYSVTVGLR